jgi:small GTP-binding protein
MSGSMPNLPLLPNRPDNKMSNHLWLLVILVGTLLVCGQYLQALSGIHSAIAPYSGWLANGLVVLTLVATAGLAGLGWQWIRPQPSPQPAQAKGSRRPRRLATRQQVSRQIQATDQLIAQLQNTIARQDLLDRSQQIQAALQDETLHLVVFGTASAGKTSLVNALLGRWVGQTAPTLGTTVTGSAHTYTIAGVKSEILLTDTPGLQTIGQAGETEARQLAATADLLVFVVAGDLLASEYEELLRLARSGKQAILALNKTDQMIPADVDTILNHLRQRTQGVIPPQQVVAIAAQPQPLKIKHVHADGTVDISYEDQDPDTQALVDLIAGLLQTQGHHLRLANALNQTQTLAQSAQAVLSQQRRDLARQAVEQMQWATAAAVAATPLPALDLLATIAINARLVYQLHQLYERPIQWIQAKTIAQSLGQVLFKLGGVELATQTLGSLLKASPLALVGIPVQAMSAAYLTRIAGLGYVDLLRSQENWELDPNSDQPTTQPDEASLTERIQAQLRRHRQPAQLQQFAQRALQVVPTLMAQPAHPLPHPDPAPEKLSA